MHAFDERILKRSVRSRRWPLSPPQGNLLSGLDEPTCHGLLWLGQTKIISKKLTILDCWGKIKRISSTGRRSMLRSLLGNILNLLLIACILGTGVITLPFPCSHCSASMGPCLDKRTEGDRLSLPHSCCQGAPNVACHAGRECSNQTDPSVSQAGPRVHSPTQIAFSDLPSGLLPPRQPSLDAAGPSTGPLPAPTSPLFLRNLAFLC
jgi:hypothetical protein